MLKLGSFFLETYGPKKLCLDFIPKNRFEKQNYFKCCYINQVPNIQISTLINPGSYWYFGNVHMQNSFVLN